MDLKAKVYCSLCGLDIKECKCRKTMLLETKVAEPEETKTKKSNKKSKEDS